MHTDHGEIPPEYNRYIVRKLFFIIALFLMVVFVFLFSLSIGAAKVSLAEVLHSLMHWDSSGRSALIVRNIRLPQAVTALLAGAGLSAAGVVMQAILRNPLGSPFTLGISHAAAFGAAASVMILGSGIITSNYSEGITVLSPYLITVSAFCCSLLAAIVIILISRMRGARPDVMVLAGVALGALFTAGTMFLQYFATDVQLAAMVFWTFGDTARAGWAETGLIAAVLFLSLIFFGRNNWNYNAMEAGEETARGLGVSVQRVRLLGMLSATLLTSVIISFLGIIGFVGLVAPHMVRKVLGSDHRFLLPAASLCGALLLLLSDTVARVILAPHILPVSVLTAFLGAPIFLLLIIQRNRS